MDYYGCYMLTNYDLHFNGRIDTDDKSFAACCERLPNGAQKPAISLDGSAEEVLENFINTRKSALEYLQKEGDEIKNIKKEELDGCKNCANFQKHNYKARSSSKFVNLSMYPAPCQCNCIYCTVDKKWENTPKVKQAYEKMFEVLELADKKGLISPDAVWQISSGEITIHPYKERILSMVEDKQAIFYTNAFIYDDGIAKNLAKNKNSKINLSVDAGTSQTWARVKGVDNFNEVVDNLIAYRKASVGPGQIDLKYIVLPGINDSEEDFVGLIELMNKLDVSHLILSRDSVVKYTSSKRDNFKLMKSAARITWCCLKNNKTVDLFPYSDKERRLIWMIIRFNRLKNIFKRKS